MRVALLPTGRTEWHGLPVALQRLFPAHEFYALPEDAVFRSMGPFDGLTSSRLTEKHEGAYLPERASEADCPRWVEKGRKKADRPKWLGDEREQHPKGYLQWLCREGNAKGCTSYDESIRGAEALRRLDWDVLLSNRGIPYLGALIEDLAEALGEPLPLPMSTSSAFRDASPPPPSLTKRPRDHVLRNL